MVEHDQNEGGGHLQRRHDDVDERSIALVTRVTRVTRVMRVTTGHETTKRKERKRMR